MGHLVSPDGWLTPLVLSEPLTRLSLFMEAEHVVDRVDYHPSFQTIAFLVEETMQRCFLPFPRQRT
jgi:hypothetical protein